MRRCLDNTVRLPHLIRLVHGMCMVKKTWRGVATEEGERSMPKNKVSTRAYTLPLSVHSLLDFTRQPHPFTFIENASTRAVSSSKKTLRQWCTSIIDKDKNRWTQRGGGISMSCDKSRPIHASLHPKGNLPVMYICMTQHISIFRRQSSSTAPFLFVFIHK